MGATVSVPHQGDEKLLCRQSPIALPALVPVPNNGHFLLAYGSGDASVVHDGPNIFVLWCGGPTSVLVLEGNVYHPKQFHFHTPSEHTVAGIQFPLELHIVHADANDNLAVVAFVFVYGDADNKFLNEIWSFLPQLRTHEQAIPIGTIDGSVLLQAHDAFYHYSGSLTTPPFAEGVEWIVCHQPRMVSPAQVAALFTAMQCANARTLQPLNDRTVVLYGS
ncbi:carbonate dehydratase [Achlya hypogyna]|uniref:Carbonic anhydrase n=1 Tax=Achlya hypogyna TaxID=1202772 RepID=A0A1V9YYE0_ACHHY|nr:carbonate dehydratase [Achlya hypogyna]